MDFDFSAKHSDAEVVAITVFDEDTLDIQMKYLRRCVENDANFSAKRGQTLLLPAPKTSGYKKIMLLGAGKAENLRESSLDGAWRPRQDDPADAVFVTSSAPAATSA